LGLKPVLECRSRVLQSLRSFFLERGYIEVETPVRVAAPATELHIDAEPSGDWYLRTSPELHMKRLVAAGLERVFQVGPCFRRGEKGRLHNPEYTMLEWYCAGSGYMDVLVDAKGLLTRIMEDVLGDTGFLYRGARIETAPVWEIFPLAEVFTAFAGWDPVTDYDADRFDLDMVEKIVPRLPKGRPVVLKDYPVEAAALARCREDTPPVAERWELFVGGMELVNAFSELTDAAEQRRRFEEWTAERRNGGRPTYPLDEPFLSALEEGMPPCGGAALGVDRLVMLLTDSDSIDEVRPFSG